MSNIAEYIDFINGNLGMEAEQKFAEQMAIDEEFRSGFRVYLSVTRSINKNINKFAPAADTTNSIFATLGYQAPPSLNVPMAGVKTSMFKSPLFTGLITGISSAVAVAIIMLMFFKPGDKNTNDVLSGNKAAVAPRSDEVTQSISTEQDINEKKNSPIMKHIYGNTNNDVNIIDTHNEENTNPNRRIENFNPYIMSGKAPALNTRAFSLMNRKSFSGITTLPALKNDESILYNFSIQYSNSINKIFPGPTIEPAKRQLFNNQSLTLLYSFNDYISAGGEIRGENFFLRYHDFDRFGTGYTYELQPNFTTYTALVRLSYFEFLNIKPLLQLSLGANSVGWVLREMVGAAWSPHSNTSFVIGIEQSNLFFSRGGGNYNSGKFSINYGISYRFN